MNFIIAAAVKAVKTLYNTDIAEADINLQETRKEFEGQVTIVTFPFTRFSKKSPEKTGTDIGEFLQNEVNEVSGFNVIKGFLNISLSDSYWLDQLNNTILTPDFTVGKPNGKKVMVEYSSPNTNKPLHLGHVRNNLLGFSVSEILAADGYEVIKANLVNDRGIHICKSMLAWQDFGNGETPVSSHMKGDKLVGKYYVIADKQIKKELSSILDGIYKQNDLSIFSTSTLVKVKSHLEKISVLENNIYNDIDRLIDDLGKIGYNYFGLPFHRNCESILDKEISVKQLFAITTSEFSAEDKEVKLKQLNKLLKTALESEEKIEKEKEEITALAKSATPFTKRAQGMLKKWEADDEEVISLWKTMNGWVYEGFTETYNKLGVSFDKFYYESNTYLLGKDIVEEGLASGVFFQKPDGSVWIDLTADGLDEKLVRRADGTSVYITQDLGTAQLKYDDYHMDESIYVVGNEQDYHFKVLFLILQKLGKTWAKGLFHLSYGMVDLPSGKMKSREGTVVDADDLISEMEQTAKTQTEALGKVEGYSEEDKNHLYHIIGMGALKYFLLKVEPKKRLLFDPNESIDFQGHTGPFIQYTHARIKSVLSRAGVDYSETLPIETLDAVERDLIIALTQFPEIISQAAKNYSPAIIANYVYELAKTFNKFYHEKSILQAEDETLKKFRLQLSAASARVISKGMGLLGIEVPERM
ncbi:arginine--tRNA ligase [Mucilaginibacter jinjuensis]|uniref:Arginine--tRNA ligase n=1 Tax=Mucilaginibacter jinjuensis TaxID=1176721 RepID=A0ABY7T151_9SPHI|nr:arginine--tRNA ligase [Mucilaginibacter jinjuensis]WCT10076.1 arginine--tRNA ligase [Mucilaginibacter jinjuensis]